MRFHQQVAAPAFVASILCACGDLPAGPFLDALAQRFAERIPVLVGAGDIAACNSSGDEATAALLDDIAGTVFTAGDNAYDFGTPIEFQKCYDPSWGRHRQRTRPSAGNHDYATPGAAGYFAYFGAAAGPPGQGYYSYDRAGWHVVVIESNRQTLLDDPVQQAWLRQDLASHPARCTLAYWHHPRFSSGTTHGSDPNMEDIWQILYDAGADVVVAGHEHNYERFAPQSPQGAPDAGRGIRQFVVGTGGRSLYPFGAPIANSEFRYNADYGVLKLVLRARDYSWEFINTTRTVVDRGRDACH
jgi:hypothetical protein